MQNKTLVIISILFVSNLILAQNSTALTLNVDLVSRYVWRGADFGNSPAIQPSVTLGIKNFEIGVWGSYPTNTESKVTDEFDMWASYKLESEVGSFSAIFTDYYYPSAGIKFGNYNNYDNLEGAGGHILELGVSYSGTENFPITVSGFINVYNEKGNSTYLELSYSTSLNDIDCTALVGVTNGNKDNPDFYGSESFAVINSGFQFSKNISITEKFSLPLSLAVLYNPSKELTYVVIGISL